MGEETHMSRDTKVKTIDLEIVAMILQGTNQIRVMESQMFTAEGTTAAIILKGGVRVHLQEKGSATRILASTSIAVNIEMIFAPVL